MILVERKPLETVADVRRALQYAIEIEHSTIPPYLVALYSLGTAKNDAIRDILRGIVIQEMGHFALAANILIALGGTPRFTDPAFVPNYPGGLPFKIGDRDGNALVVHLAPFSIELVRDTFMVIESPEDPLHFQVKPHPALFAALAVDQETYQTIGEFYDALKAKLTDLGDDAFTGKDRPQPTGFPGDVFAIRSLADALRAIDLIVQQGEGTKTTPLAGGGTAVAHYYRFEQIVKGFALVADPSVPEKYSYSGEPIPFDPSVVAPILTDAKTSDYADGSMARRVALQFDTAYAGLLAALEAAFAGAPDALTNAIGMMYDLMIFAQKLMATPAGNGKTAAPTFEFPVPVAP
ncbi:MAG: ferritin-like protein [Candidatus Eremiobacteraeota bacterium]|nr:ferritin-like protein [Candidatus Eremiobacteraeota bacterium]